MALLRAAHLLLAVMWVGGMYFAYACLRPASGALAPEQRLPLWRGTLRRFLAAVWVAVIGLPLSGYAMAALLYGVAGWMPLHVVVMQAIGWPMIALFLVLWFGPWRRLRAAVDRGDMAAAGTALAGIRRIVAVNLLLGVVLIAVVSGMAVAGL